MIDSNEIPTDPDLEKCTRRRFTVAEWLKRQGLISIRSLWMQAHGYA
jgi:hypothetical protein